MNTKNIYKRSIKFIVLGLATMIILSNIPITKLSLKETLMITVYMSMIYALIDSFGEKLTNF